MDRVLVHLRRGHAGIGIVCPAWYGGQRVLLAPARLQTRQGNAPPMAICLIAAIGVRGLARGTSGSQPGTGIATIAPVFQCWYRSGAVVVAAGRYDRHGSLWVGGAAPAHDVLLNRGCGRKCQLVDVCTGRGIQAYVCPHL